MPLIDLNGLGHFKDKENAMIAEDFSASKAYAAGDYCYYNGTLYKFKTAHAAGAWTIADVEAAKLAHDVSDLKESISNIETEVAASFEQKTITNVAVASFNDGADGVPVKKLVVDIEPVQGGSGDPSPDNIRPITGWTSAKVNRARKNFLDTSTTSIGVITFTQDIDGYITCNSTSDTRTWSYLNSQYKITLPAGTYKFVYDIKTASITTGRGYRVLTEENTVLTNGYDSSFNISGASTAFTLTKPTKLGVMIKQFEMVARFMIVVSNETTDYEPYAGETYDISFPSEAGTLYGGSLDATNGILTVNTAIITIDGTNISFNGKFAGDNVAVPSVMLNTYGLPAAISTGHALMANYLHRPTNGVILESNSFNVNGNLVSAHIEDLTGFGSGMEYETLSALLTAANAYVREKPLTILYKMASTITYQLDPVEVTTLLSTNNIWADTGDIAELAYRAMNNTSGMIKLTKALIAPVLDSMVADTALVVNDFRIVGDTLYKVTAPIASGGTLTVGTNVAATTVADILKSLLN